MASSEGGRVTYAASSVVIQSDSDFVSCSCVTGGSGTTGDPYIIGPLTVSHSGGDAVHIDGTNLTKSFVLLDVTIIGNAGTGVVLNHINPNGTPAIAASVAGTQTSIQKNNLGILVRDSSFVTLDGGGANPRGPGIGNREAGTINKNLVGAIDVEDSSHVLIRGWQLSANGADVSPDWVTLDPAVSKWGVGGVRFFQVVDSTIDHNAANNDTDVSYSLFHSSRNIISNNTANYPFAMNFLVADGSSHNTLTGNDASTGDFIGLMVADPPPETWTLNTYGPSHDNIVRNNQIHTNGPTGNEVHANVVPAFLGGIVVLNGTYDNTVTGNQAWASTGGDLVWAQAAPDASTPIGVATAPPAVHCNVTASEGGGGVANLNGNVWTGNTYQQKDTCLPPQ